MSIIIDYHKTDVIEQRSNHKRKNKKHYLILLAAIVMSALFITYSQYEKDSVIKMASDMEGKPIYLFQDLVGDQTNTWLSWNLTPGQILHIDIIDGANLPHDKILAVKDAILSTQTVEISDWMLHKGLPGDSSTYYKGWQGALAVASSHQTKFYIPQKFEIDGSANSDAQITIMLTNDKNPDGLSGHTKSIIDGNHILKTTITIYGANHLPAERLSTIMRHEFGHALGLAHSTAPEDLMAPEIVTQYPYISECDIDAIVGLYDGNQKSKVICRK